MKRIRVALRVALLGAAVTMPVSADAPISGPDQQYDNFDSGNKVISDRFTGLTWERPASPYPAAMKFSEAQGYCQGTMRLPSLKELLTLVDEEPHDEYDGTKNVPRYIDQRAFPKTPAEGFWTSSMKDASSAFTVDFGTGATSPVNIVQDSRRVRCVDYMPQ